MKLNKSNGWIKVVGVTVILTLTLGLAGCSGAKDKKAETPAGQKTESQEPVLIKTLPLENTKFEGRVEISGNAAPFEVAVVASKINGDLTYLGADLGTSVRKGQVLARVNDTRYGLTKEKIGLGLQSSQLTLDNQKKDLARLQELYKENAISEKELESAINGLKQTQIGFQQSQNDMKLADLNLKDTAIMSPISGHVSEKRLIVGESVNPGTAIFTVVDTSKVYVDTGVSEDLVNAVSKNMKVKLTFTALNNAVYEGTVQSVSPVQDKAKLYGIRILINNADGNIKAGMFAKGDIERSNGVTGVGIPKLAVLHSEGKDYAFVMENGKAVRKEIVVGLGNDKMFQIKKGLNVGEQVIVVGQEKVQDGSPVKIQP